MTNDVILQKIYEAYRKFKNYSYYDSASLFSRKRVAEFEEELYGLTKKQFKKKFAEKLDGLSKVLLGINEQYFQRLLDDMDFCILPKRMKKDSVQNADSIKLISNHIQKEKLEIEKYNIFIDAPVEIQLISTLWVMFVGVKLSKLISPHNYAYRLSLTSPQTESQQTKISSGLHIYKPYFQGYQDWRDNALKKANEILDSHKDVTIVSLDITRYFYNVRLNLSEFVEKLLEENAVGFSNEEERTLANRLTRLLSSVHEAYTEKCKDFLPEEVLPINENAPMLPVGLVSSGVIGNLFLADFDKKIIETIHPDYYGRYVDDMLFVIGESKADDAVNFLNKYFVKPQILVSDNNEYKLIAHDANFSIQSSKIIVESFEHTGSKAALMNFRRNIQRQRSEFRFLPDEETVEQDFDEAAFSMQYSGSVNKLRNIKDFTEDKYGASTYLAHMIFLACYKSEENKKHKKAIVQQILTYFKGAVALEYYSLWEKVFTYFVITEDVVSLNKFQKQIFDAIEQCNLEKFRIQYKIKECLKKTLQLSEAIPLSMHLQFIKAENEWNEDTIRTAIKLRHASMFRHQYLGIGGLNLTKCLLDDNYNLYHKDYDHKIELLKETGVIYLTPLFVHLDVICHICIFIKSDEYKYSKTKSINEFLSDAPSKSFKLYHSINWEWDSLFYGQKKRNKNDLDIRKEIASLEIGKYKSKVFEYIIPTDEKNFTTIKSNKRIGIVNMNVDKDIIEKTALNQVNLSSERRKDLFRLINDAIANKCDVLVLPELSVPYQWIDLLAAESKKNQIAIIAGLTYLVTNSKYALNIVVTILPFTKNNYKSCVIIPRVKNHYAPKEETLLRSYGYHVPNEVKSIYHLIHWKKSYFSVYNCFELASIEDRFLMKSKVDFIVATELNSDTNYYSDIAGSWVRDIHSFFIQVNTSEYGDSRIMKPSKSVEKNMVVVKGGKNSTILIDDLDIDALRKFQLPGYAAQDAKAVFKYTPPGFIQKDVKTRIDDKDFKKY